MKQTDDSFESAEDWLARKNPSINAKNDGSTLVKERLIINRGLEDRVERLSTSQIQFETQAIGQLEALKQSTAAQIAALTKKTRWKKFVWLVVNVRAVLWTPWFFAAVFVSLLLILVSLGGLLWK